MDLRDGPLRLTARFQVPRIIQRLLYGDVQVGSGRATSLYTYLRTYMHIIHSQHPQHPY